MEDWREIKTVPHLRPVNKAVFAKFLARGDDSSTGSHAKAWNDVRPLFEMELAKCKNSNFEFSTSCGEYLAQLDYMDSNWTKKNIFRIFPEEFPSNSLCALEGLAFASFTRSVYGCSPNPASSIGRYAMTSKAKREENWLSESLPHVSGEMSHWSRPGSHTYSKLEMSKTSNQ